MGIYRFACSHCGMMVIAENILTSIVFVDCRVVINAHAIESMNFLFQSAMCFFKHSPNLWGCQIPDWCWAFVTPVNH